MSDLVATPGISLPEQATEFLNYLYPNDEYTDLQYLPNAITSEGMYYIAYEDGRTVCFDDAGEGGGYVFGAGCAEPNGTPIENIRAMVEVSERNAY